MQPVVNQRRARGLSASVIDLGMIVGVGYMNRAGPKRVETMEQRFDYMRVSETALHDIFGQTIVAGHLGSGYPSELITGLSPASSTRTPLWYDHPIFSHHRSKASLAQNVDMDTAAVSVAVIKQQIETKSAEEALEILRSSLSAQLAQTLQLKTDAIQFDKPLIQLGVDSLMAVEISSQI
jgi:acyl carrier protein